MCVKVNELQANYFHYTHTHTAFLPTQQSVGGGIRLSLYRTGINIHVHVPIHSDSCLQNTGACVQCNHSNQDT